MFHRTGIGGVIALPASGGGGKQLRFRVTGRSEYNTPIVSLQLVVNGNVMDVPLDVDSTPHKASGVVLVDVKAGAWVCGVAHANDTLLSDEELERYTDPFSMRVVASRQRFAHTSPVYITVGGVGAHVAASVAEGDAILEYYGRFARSGVVNPELSELVAQALSQANATLHKTHY